MRFLPAFPCQLLATVLVLLSLATSGFAHRFAPVDLSPELQAYVANGGALADLCDTGDSPHSGTMADCKTCRLIGAMALAVGIALPRLARWRLNCFQSNRME